MSDRANVVAVTGATGFVGRHVCRALAQSGWSVRALVRDRAKAARVLPRQGVTLVQGDVADKASLDSLMQGCHAAVHCIGIRREVAPAITFKRLHVEATRVVLESAQAQGVARFVHISALGTRPDAASAYHKTKFEAESLVRRSGLKWTILRPSLIHGPDGEFMQMTKNWVLGRAAPWFILPYFVRVLPPSGMPPVPKFESAMVQPIHIDDVALVAALAKPEAVGEVYPLGGSETLDWPTLLRAVRDALPVTEPWKQPAPLPGLLGVAMAKAAGVLGLSELLPFCPSEPLMAIEDSTCAMDKAAAHLGLHTRPFLESMKAYAAQI
jgi:uncharacterized protein YbjT (DUF2867 family)